MAATLREREVQRAHLLWARAASGDARRLLEAHHIQLRAALRAAGLVPCAGCRKKAIVERMVGAATKAACPAAPAAAARGCLERVLERKKSRGGRPPSSLSRRVAIILGSQKVLVLLVLVLVLLVLVLVLLRFAGRMGKGRKEHRIFLD